MYEPMTDISQCPASDANGMHFCHFVSDGTQSRYGPKWNSLEVHVQSGDDDSHAPVGELIADVHEVVIQELRFINAYDIDPRGEEQDAG